MISKKKIIINKLLIAGIVFLSVGCKHKTKELTVISLSGKYVTDSVSYESSEKRPLKVAVSAILSPREAYQSYEKIFHYISEKVDRPIELHQRRTCSEINDMLENNLLDFAFICSGAYIKLDPAKGVRLLTIAQTSGNKYYRSFIITQRNFKATGLEDLRGSTFAFTDSMSGSGFYYVNHRLKEIGEKPETFFASTIFTHGHDISVQMVAKGIVDAASVSHLIFEILHHQSPERVKNLKVIDSSGLIGMPPVVVSSGLDEELKTQIYNVFMEMHNDEKAHSFMEDLMIDRFLAPADDDYNSIREMQY